MCAHAYVCTRECECVSLFFYPWLPGHRYLAYFGGGAFEYVCACMPVYMCVCGNVCLSAAPINLILLARTRIGVCTQVCVYVSPSLSIHLYGPEYAISRFRKQGYGQTDERTNGRMDRCSNGWTDRQPLF